MNCRITMTDILLGFNSDVILDWIIIELLPNFEFCLHFSYSHLTLDFVIYFSSQVALSFHIPSGNWKQCQSIYSTMVTGWTALWAISCLCVGCPCRSQAIHEIIFKQSYFTRENTALTSRYHEYVVSYVILADFYSIRCPWLFFCCWVFGGFFWFF